MYICLPISNMCNAISPKSCFHISMYWMFFYHATLILFLLSNTNHLLCHASQDHKGHNNYSYLDFLNPELRYNETHNKLGVPYGVEVNRSEEDDDDEEYSFSNKKASHEVAPKEYDEELVIPQKQVATILEPKEPPFYIINTARHTSSLIFLHNYGTYADQWEDDLKRIQQPYMRVVCPQANIEPVIYFEEAELFSWFDFQNRHYPQINQSFTSINKAVNYIHKLIDYEINEHLIKPERIIVGGFGQGAALALYSALSYPKKLGMIIALSPFLPDHDIFNGTLKLHHKHIPIYLTHLHNDMYTPNNTHILLADQLKYRYSDIVHPRVFSREDMVDKEKFNELKEFMIKHVGPINSHTHEEHATHNHTRST